MIDEVRHFLANTTEDHFKIQGQFSDAELLERISKYDELVGDLASELACIAYWAKPMHRAILQKAFARSTDRLDSQGGTVVWLSLRWYPLLTALYCAGIAAVEGKRYESLACIFYTRLGHAEYGKSGQYLIEAVAKCILDYNRMDLFKKIPGHERYHTPISEYLHKSLQPKLDDLLFVGRGYETAFDEFEVLFALAVADLHRLSDRHVWGPVGRFGWKGDRGYENPLGRVIEEARSLGANWEPLRAGLFGGSLERFEAVATEFQQQVSRLNWW